MKLLSCHIENYGKFSKKDFEFNKDVTAFCEDNGYGKSTLASFLKAMFFGLETDRASSGFNERRHFCPFEGGNFGGYLILTMRGKEYKIERYFDEKSETRDTLRVFCNGKQTNEFLNVGEEVFGIDKQSFERTIFISADEIEIKSTGSINTRLNNFLEGCDDDTNLAAAVGLLEKKSKEYKKSRQGNDLITAQNGIIVRLSEDIANVKTISDSLPAKYAIVAEIERREKELVAAVTKAQTQNVVLKDWEMYDDICEQYSECAAIVENIQKKYPQGLPQYDEINEVTALLDREKALLVRQSQKVFTDEDGERYSVLYEKFKNGLPEDSEIEQIGEILEELSTVKSQLDLFENAEQTQREKGLLNTFSQKCADDKEIEKLEALREKYKEAQQKADGITDFAEGNILAPQQAPNYKRYAIVAIICAVIAVLGAGMLFANTVVGIILIVVGAAGIVLAGFLFLNKKTGVQTANNTRLENPEKAALRREIDELGACIRGTLSSYGYLCENGVIYSVSAFIADAREYKILHKKITERERTIKKKQEERDALEGTIGEFFSRYGYSGDNYILISALLKSDVDNYKTLLLRKNAAAEQCDRYVDEVKDIRKNITDFAQRYGVDGEITALKIKKIEGDIKDCAEQTRKYAELLERAHKFKAEKKLDERPAVGATEISGLNEQLSEVRQQKSLLMREITADEYEAEKLDDLINERLAEKEKLEEYKRRHGILLKTIDCLVVADRRLKDKYVKPVKDKFLYYSALIEKVLGEQVVMDTDFEIRFVRGGKERSDKHLSSGQKSICALCFRLALLGNMYAGEKPFLILDDPFVNLDEEHFDKVKAMIKEIKEKFQIIYFTCHSSRALQEI